MIEGALDLVRIAHRRPRHRHRKRGSSVLELAHVGCRHHGIGRVLDESHARDAGSDLLEQLQPFHRDHWLIVREAGDIAAGPRQAGDKTESHRIGNAQGWLKPNFLHPPFNNKKAREAGATAARLHPQD
jgi:hypothetical protein